MKFALSLVFVLSSLGATAFAQTTPLGGGIAAGPEQRVAPARISAVEAQSQWMLGLVPQSDGVLALGTRSTSATPPRLTSVRIGRNGAIDHASERNAGDATGLASVGSTAAIRLVAWRSGNAVVASPLAADGTLIHPAGKVIAQSDFAAPIEVQCNTSRCLVAWSADFRSGAIVDADVNVERIVPLPWRSSLLAADPGGFLLVRSGDAAETRVIRIDNEGAQTSDTRLTQEIAWLVAADFDGADYTVAFADPDRIGFPTAVQRVAGDGTLGARRDLFVPREIDDYSGLAIAWNGMQHLVTISSGRAAQVVFLGIMSDSDLYGIRLDRNHIPIGSEFRISPNPGINASPKVVANGDAFYVAWHYAQGSFSFVSIVGARVDAAGQASAPDALWRGPVSQLPVAVASAGSESLAVWRETDRLTGRNELRAVRLSPMNTAVDAEPIVLTDAYGVGKVSAAALGSDYLVTWNDSPEGKRQLRAAIIRANGSVERLTINGIDTLSPSVAADANSWLIAASNLGGSVRAVRIARGGFVLTPTPIILLEQVAEYDLTSVASNGNGFLVIAAVAAYQGCTGNCAGVFAIPINADGSLASAARRFGDTPHSTAVAASGSEYLAAAVMSSTRIEVTRLLPSGTAVGQSLLTPAGFPTTPLLARFGSGWLASWNEGTSGHVVRLDELGSPLTQPATTELLVAIAAKGDRSVTALYAKTIDDAVATMVRELTDTTIVIGRRRTSTR